MTVERDCVAFTPSCPPDAGGGGTYFEEPTRLPAEQAVYGSGEPADKVLQSFDLPAGENTLFHVWGYLIAAADSFGPQVQALFLIGKVARADDGTLALNELSLVASTESATLLGAFALALPGGDTVNVTGDRAVAADVEYCLQLTYAPCELETVTLPIL